ncbi:MAG: hypothetical protein AAFS07_02700 [Pseudomonadota bacterium]
MRWVAGFAVLLIGLAALFSLTNRRAPKCQLTEVDRAVTLDGKTALILFVRDCDGEVVTTSNVSLLPAALSQTAGVGNIASLPGDARQNPEYWTLEWEGDLAVVRYRGLARLRRPTQGVIGDHPFVFIQQRRSR